MSNTFAPIPNSFDLFANDLNKQSLNSPPSSSASSSTSSLTSKYSNNRGILPASSKLANYKTSVKILTSSVDKDLNKITFSKPNDIAKQEEIKPKSNIPAPRQSMIPSLKTSSGIPIPAFKSSIPTFKSSGQVLRNSTNNNNIAIKVKIFQIKFIIYRLCLSLFIFLEIDRVESVQIVFLFRNYLNSSLINM